MKQVKISYDELPEVVARLVENNEKIMSLLTERIGAERPARDLMGADETAELLGLSKSCVYQKVHRREIPFIKLQGSTAIRFSRKAITSWLEAGQKHAA